MGNVSETMHRIRVAIRDYDPSYKLKVNGHICAKEWREIIGGGYRYYLLDTKIIDVRDAVKREELLRKRFEEDVVRYSMDDVAVISEVLRAATKRKQCLSDGKNS